MVARLAELALVGISNSKSADTKLVWHGRVRIQEGQWGITAKLGIGSEWGKVLAIVDIVGKRDTEGEIGRGV